MNDPHEDGFCLLGTTAASLEENKTSQCSMITVNNGTTFKYEYVLNKHPLRGMVIQHMDADNITGCHFSEPYVFDTYGSEMEAKRLDEYLSTLEEGSVIIGTTITDFTVSLKPAKERLIRLGLPIECIHFGGVLTFVSIIGKQTVFD